MDHPKNAPSARFLFHLSGGPSLRVASPDSTLYGSTLAPVKQVFESVVFYLSVRSEIFAELIWQIREIGVLLADGCNDYPRRKLRKGFHYVRCRSGTGWNC